MDAPPSRYRRQKKSQATRPALTVNTSSQPGGDVAAKILSSSAENSAISSNSLNSGFANVYSNSSNLNNSNNNINSSSNDKSLTSPPLFSPLFNKVPAHSLADPMVAGPSPIEKPALRHAGDQSYMIDAIDISLPTQMVRKEEIDGNMRVGDFLINLCTEHRYELGNDADECMIWEVIQLSTTSETKIRRPLRPFEYLKYVYNSWDLDSGALYSLQVTSAVFKLDTKSVAFLNRRRDLLREGAAVALNRKVQTLINGSWCKVSLSALSNGQLSITRAIHHSDDRSISIEEFELYEGVNLGAPAKYTICLRSQQNPRYFVNKADMMCIIATDSESDYDLLRNILYTLRTQACDKLSRQYANYLEHNNSVASFNSEPEELQLIDQIQPPHIGSSNSLPERSGDSNGEFVPDSLLGKSYSTKSASRRPKKTSNTTAAAPVFAANSLLATSQQKQQNAAVKQIMPINPVVGLGDRGLLGSAYSYGANSGGISPSTGGNQVKLPTHSIAVGHGAVRKLS